MLEWEGLRAWLESMTGNSPENEGVMGIIEGNLTYDGQQVIVLQKLSIIIRQSAVVRGNFHIKLFFLTFFTLTTELPKRQPGTSLTLRLTSFDFLRGPGQ